MKRNEIIDFSRISLPVLSGTALAISEPDLPRWLTSAACIEQVDNTLCKEVSKSLLVTA